jgi:hypothetical protein
MVLQIYEDEHDDDLLNQFLIYRLYHTTRKQMFVVTLIHLRDWTYEDEHDDDLINPFLIYRSYHTDHKQIDSLIDSLID